MFEPLMPVLDALDCRAWPTIAGLQQLVTSRRPMVVSGGGVPLQLVKQDAKATRFEARYEPRAYLKGELQVRENDWHDLFNLLVWLTFPRAKAALNARHYQSQQARAGQVNRGASQDALTLVDESGVIVAASDPGLLDLLRNFAWKELFWNRRERIPGALGVFLFGHGLYEKALQPYVGMTGHCLLFDVAPTFFGRAATAQVTELDAMAARLIEKPDRLPSTRELHPLPVLGVPGWSGDNENADYYENTAYFRLGRRGR
jgi:hypothetical protein